LGVQRHARMSVSCAQPRAVSTVSQSARQGGTDTTGVDASRVAPEAGRSRALMTTANLAVVAVRAQPGAVQGRSEPVPMPGRLILPPRAMRARIRPPRDHLVERFTDLTPKKQAGKFEGLPRRLVRWTGTRCASEP